MFTNHQGGRTASNDLKSTLAVNHAELVEFLTERPTIPVAAAELVAVVTAQVYAENAVSDELDVAFDLGLELDFDFYTEQVEASS